MSNLNFHIKYMYTVLKVFVLLCKQTSTQNLDLLLKVNELDFPARHVIVKFIS